MITIDWKERLVKDTLYYLEKKIPKNDYDFEIIFNWYPERVQGRIPNEVIQLVARTLAIKLARQHEQYIPFYQFLWEKKGEYGKLAFMQFMLRFIPKKPNVYLPLLEKNLLKANAHDIAMVFEKVILPLWKKQDEPYLSQLFRWLECNSELLRKQSALFLIKLLKRKPELTASVLGYLQNRWVYPLTDSIPIFISILKAIWKLDSKAVLELFREYGQTRDPQTVEILCGSITEYHPELLPITENWTHSGNARLKKAATAAHKLLQKRKP